MIENYLLHLLIIACVYVVLAMSLDLALGYTGLVNLGHVAFYGIGAYASALITLKLGLPFWIALLAAGLVAALFGWLLSFPTLRLKGDYLVIGTIGFTIITQSVMKNWTALTRGPLGIPGIPKPELFGITFNTLPEYAFLALAFAAGTFLILRLVIRSPFGRLLQAVRDDEIAASTLGKDTFRIKMKALALSAFFAGVAGSLYAHYITFIDPSSFSLLEMVFILSTVLVGGAGTLWGGVAGTLLLVLIPEPLRFLPFPPDVVGGMRQALYALILVLVVMKRPQGLLGKVAS